MEAIIPRYPDFIICGAPKCGTTSMHKILAQHPDIGIPGPELFYFDGNDPSVHKTFLKMKDGALVNKNPHPDSDSGTRELYFNKLKEFEDLTLIGEDSTTYIFSDIAAYNIHKETPDVKLIFMLRDPVRRAYSQYWHALNHGRIACSFESSMFQHPFVLRGSVYFDNIQRYLRYFDRKQIKVVLFEDFMANKQEIMNEMTDFLGTERFTVTEGQDWYNRTYYPNWMFGQYCLNQIGKHVVKLRYNDHLRMGKKPFSMRLKRKIHQRYFRHINPIFLKNEKAPPMKDSTREFLQDYFSRANDGLSEFLERDLSEVWKGFRG